MTKKELKKQLKKAQEEVDLLTKEMTQSPGGIWLLRPENACRYGRAMGIRDALREVIYGNPAKQNSRTR